MSVYPLPPRSFLLNEIEIIQIIKLLLEIFIKILNPIFSMSDFSFIFTEIIRLIITCAVIRGWSSNIHIETMSN